MKDFLFKWSFLILCCCLLLKPVWVKAVEGEDRLSLNGYWQFQTLEKLADALPLVHPDTVWHDSDSLSVPGNWDTESAYALHRGLGIYRKEVHVPAEWKNDVIRIHFEAVYETAYVYVNGHYVGSHKGGYTPFEFRIEDLVTIGERNTIAVVADNSYGRGAWWAWGGISRDVSLVKNNAVRIKQLKIRPEVDLQTKTGRVNINYTVENNGMQNRNMTVSVKLFEDKEHRSTLLDTTYTMSLGNENSTDQSLTLYLPEMVKLWHFDDPNLYGCEVLVHENGKAVHNKRTTFGFRTVEIKGHQLLLNGESIRLAGFNRVHDHRAVGNTEPLWLIKRDLDHMKSLGCNMTRMMHAPLSPELLAYADEIGMLIIQEIPVWGRDDPQAFENNPVTKTWLKEMIDRDYNHPSIIGWSVANELSLDIQDWKTIRLSREQHQYVASMIKYVKDELDTTRLVTYVNHTAFREDIYPSIEPAQHADMICFNSYGDFVLSAEKIHERWPNKLILMTEFGLNQVGYHRDDTLDQRVLDKLKDISKLPYVAGASLWTYNDYRSNYQGTPLGGDRTWGVVDVWRNPKQAARQIQAAFAPVADMHAIWESGKSSIAVTLQPRGKMELPAYIMRGYHLTMALYTNDGQELYHADTLRLQDVYPGDKAIQHIFSYPKKLNNKSAYLKVSLMSPTGHCIGERLLYNKLPSRPQIRYTLHSDSLVRIYFATDLSASEYLTVLPSGDTLITVGQILDIPRAQLDKAVRLSIYARNDQGKSKPLIEKVEFSGKPVPPLVRAVLSVTDGIVIGYDVQEKNSHYRIQYRPMKNPSDVHEVTTELEGSTKIRVANPANYELRIREERNGAESQWSPWEKVEGKSPKRKE